MASQTTLYKCPACTGPLHFDGASGKLVCDYCGSTYSVEEMEEKFGEKNEAAAKEFVAAQAKEKDKKAKAASEGWDDSGMESWGPGDGMKAYSCTSCGAELICDETTGATECPYCGNPTVIPGQFKGALKPDFIIPFKLDKKAAMDALQRHYGGKKLLPKVFTQQNHVEKIQGVYVPFWLYNGTAYADAVFKGEVTRTYRTRSEEVTEIDVYSIHRAGDVTLENIPVDASSKMDDALMDSIEPFDYSELKPFSMSYLPGFLADKYDETAERCADRADQRAANTAIAAMRNSAGNIPVVEEVTRRVTLRRGKVYYALMPVWLLNTKWNNQNFMFAMNGQTGKLVGDLPMDKSLARNYQLKWAGIVAAAVFAVSVLINFL